ncbi:phosphoribosylamine--glycine ligase [Holotrichia oblita]|nr:phosphoribosylamine--glycine ligase [Holotrichia oblita]
MNILVVGSGGREHAIVKSLKKSTKVNKIFCAPGNGGIGLDAECVPISAMDFSGLISFAKNSVDLTVVGMDEPLVAGIVDEFEKAGLKIFGPSKLAAEIEGSKSFAKEFMKKYDIPTAKYECFDTNTYENALEYVKNSVFPLVIKADGLALGKGVIICQNLEEANAALNEMLVDNKFGESGNKIVIEEFLDGVELSVLSFCDGKTIKPMVAAKDYKRAFDNDLGLNTGGMGSISPPSFYTEEMASECMEQIFLKTLSGMGREGRPFKGVLYFGLISTKDGVKVIEYNCRFGDPETQAVLMRLDSDLTEIILACVNETLDEITIKWNDKASVCVVVVSGGYPLAYEKGFEITGIDSCSEDACLFHAGTVFKDGKFYTNGGRVIGACALANTLEKAVEKAYFMAKNIKFENSRFRYDIGK